MNKFYSLTKQNTAIIVVILIVLLSLSACTSHQIYRKDYSVCISGDPVQECQKNALQQIVDPSNESISYMLGFIEFDDQGQLWDRKQMDSVLTRVNEEAGQGEVLIVTFVHGWKHSAAPGDTNIETFRDSLHRLAELENRLASVGDQPARKVIGVYLGWRGKSVSFPGLKELTFWERKNTAHKVGHGGVTEVLSRLELVKSTKDAIVANEAVDKALQEALKIGQKNTDEVELVLDKARKTKSKTRLVIVGHSFGGAVVFSALSQIIEERFLETQGPMGMLTNARSFGDLVVLINPAFEATRFSALSDMSTERGSYFASQLPVLAVLTSEADDATRRAFPIGRWLSTLFEKDHDVKRKNAVTRQEEEIDQGDANITAVGHFDPYKTHFLKAKEEVDRESIAAPSLNEDIQGLLDVADQWKNDAPSSELGFYGSTLQRTSTSAGRNPYLVVRVDEELIEDHNDIDDPRIIAFIRQIILLASQGETLDDNRKILMKMVGEK